MNRDLDAQEAAWFFGDAAQSAAWLLDFLSAPLPDPANDNDEAVLEALLLSLRF
jgi:hypothetical protein